MPKSRTVFSNQAEFFERILNSLTTGIFVCDNKENNYIVHFINDAYARYLGVPREEILGRPITDFIPDSRAPFVTNTGIAEMGDLRTLKGPDGDRVMIVNRLPFKYGEQAAGMLSQTLFGSREEFDLVTRRVEYLDKKLTAYARRIKSALSPRYSLGSIQGESPAIRQFREHLARCAREDVPALIFGATGTGKELAANALHCESPRHDGPFVSINCAAIPKELFESELFGYAPGAFSGAHKDGKIGQIELADRGSLFLDEIGDTPLPAQAKLLRVLENRTLYRLGSVQLRTVDFRLIAATNRDLKAMIADGSFREDLYYRISPLILQMPPLRERREDIPLLANNILQRMGREKARITESALEALSTYCWPGNIRELRNVIVRALSLCRDNTIDMSDLPPELLTDFGVCPPSRPMAQVDGKDAEPNLGASLPEMLASNELRLIILTLQDQDWNVTRTARMLGIARATLYEKLKKYGITRNSCVRQG
ncbi:MAG: sigma 54-interacting transcriptional regulator [Deltaproteobacteria bacterium]|jgi:transcriptional regulator with PAS, ATPase and Fis domain|nr:sigma 54-interacting transcriptional regulator [Deltaproteobacteria bacterium]